MYRKSSSCKKNRMQCAFVLYTRSPVCTTKQIAFLILLLNGIITLSISISLALVFLVSRIVHWFGQTKRHLIRRSFSAVFSCVYNQSYARVIHVFEVCTHYTTSQNREKKMVNQMLKCKGVYKYFMFCFALFCFV